MKPTSIQRTDTNNPHLGNEAKRFIDHIAATLLAVDCASAFASLLGSGQPVQREIIKTFQNALCAQLNESNPAAACAWQAEVRASEKYRDAFDLYLRPTLDGVTYHVIIELDKPRADQVAKKFLSRVSHTINEPLIYVTFCYPGTNKMSKPETIKYFGYFATLVTKMNTAATPKVFIGFTCET